MSTRPLPPHLLAWGRALLGDHPAKRWARYDPYAVRPSIHGTGLVAWDDALWFTWTTSCAALLVEEPEHVGLDPHPLDLKIVQHLGPYLGAPAHPVALDAVRRVVPPHVRRSRWRHPPDLVRFERGEHVLGVRATYLRAVHALTGPVVAVWFSEAAEDPGLDLPLVLHGAQGDRRVRLVVMPYRCERTGRVIGDVRVA